MVDSGTQTGQHELATLATMKPGMQSISGQGMTVQWTSLSKHEQDVQLSFAHELPGYGNKIESR